MVRWVSLVVAAVCTACSGSFDVAAVPDDGGVDASDDATSDSSAATDTSTTDTGTGSPTDSAPQDGTSSDGIALDTRVVESGTGVCPPANPAELWVDQSSKTGNGSSDCPFTTIRAALTYAATLPVSQRTVRVRGAGAGGGLVKYVETGPVFIRNQMRLLGDGVEKVVITGGGACGTAVNCVVAIEGGGILEGVLVDGGGMRHAIVGGAMIDGSPPTIRNTSATGSVGENMAGILVTSGANLGPNVQSYSNRVGVFGFGQDRLSVTGVGNAFDRNAEHGILLVGAAPMTFEGGSASENGINGIRIAPPAASSPVYYIGGLVAKKNLDAGVRVTSPTATLKIRSSVLLDNRIGLVFQYGANNVLDIGSTPSAGMNTFGVGGVGGNNNVRGGICLMGVRGPIEGLGNKWSSCGVLPIGGTGPSSGQVYGMTACDVIDNFRDIYWETSNTAITSNPVNTGTCTVGP